MVAVVAAVVANAVVVDVTMVEVVEVVEVTMVVAVVVVVAAAEGGTTRYIHSHACRHRRQCRKPLAVLTLPCPAEQVRAQAWPVAW